MANNYESETASRIRQLMAEKRISQRALAAQLGLSQPAVHRRITGQAPIHVHELDKIADALGVTAGDLIGDVAA